MMKTNRVLFNSFVAGRGDEMMKTNRVLFNSILFNSIL